MLPPDFYEDFTNLSLNSGDWISGLAGVNLSSDLSTELERLISNSTTMRVVLFDDTGGTGSNKAYHAQEFVLVKMTDFNVVPRTTTFTYLGEADDPETCRNFGLALSPDSAQTGQPGQTVTYTHVLTNLGHYTETAGLSYSTTPADWTVEVTPTYQILGPGRSATITTLVTIPAESEDGDTNVTTVTATLPVYPAVSASAVDTTTVDVGEKKLYLPVILKE